VRVHPLVGDQQRLACDGGLLRNGYGAVGGGDGEAVAVLDERGGREELDPVAGVGVGEDAELVAPRR
jgi:hypothetical protein